MIKQYVFADGKYCIERNAVTYHTECSRHGEPWGRDIVGDKLIHSMLDKIDELEDEIERLRDYEYRYKELCE